MTPGPIDTPLTDHEVRRLEAFLDRAEGTALTLPGVDGLFAALVCAPLLVKPSQWMPILWSGEAPEWKDIAEAREFHDLLMRHWNDVAQSINDGTYCPVFTLFGEDEAHGVVLPHDWCRGFLLGMTFHEDLWLPGDNLELGDLLKPIRKILLESAASKEPPGRRNKDVLSREERTEYMDQIPGAVVALRAYWLEHPVDDVTARRYAPQPIRTAPKIGRNEPCPCGSGKKFKHCHGRGETVM